MLPGTTRLIKTEETKQKILSAHLATHLYSNTAFQILAFVSIDVSGLYLLYDVYLQRMSRKRVFDMEDYNVEDLDV